jgi:hypothetical protein
VPFLFGWEYILTGLVLLIVLAALFLLVLSAGRGRRSEWRALLDARSFRRSESALDDRGGTSDPAGDVDRPRAR